jgi:formate dehydrogenase assembly factor FdhD
MKKEFEAIREIDGVKFYSEGYLLSREIIAKDDERKQYEQKIKELEKEIEQWKMQFSQAEMIINDIKRITKCKSDDGVTIVESVEQLKQKEDSLKLRIKERIEELSKKKYHYVIKVTDDKGTELKKSIKEYHKAGTLDWCENCKAIKELKSLLGEKE